MRVGGGVGGEFRIKCGRNEHTWIEGGSVFPEKERGKGSAEWAVGKTVEL